MAEETVFNKIVAGLVERMEKEAEAMAKHIGPHPGEEKVSRYMQLKAFKEMTAQDLMTLAQQKGPDEFAKYVIDMESGLRGKRSGNP